MLRLDCDELFFKFLYTRNFHVGPTRNRTNASRFIMKFFNYCCQPLRCQPLRIRKQIMKLKIVSLPHVYLIWQHFTLTRVEPPKTFFWFEIIFYSGTIEAFAWKLTCIILLAAATEQKKHRISLRNNSPAEWCNRRPFLRENFFYNVCLRACACFKTWVGLKLADHLQTHVIK